MRIYAFLITMLITSCAFAQMHPIDKVYIVEGVVADRETQKAIPSAILYNDSLGITTTSDENGYFKIVVPYELIKKRQTILIDIVKAGYKRVGSGFGYNPLPTDSIQIKNDQRMIWNYDVKIFWLTKDESELSSITSGCIRAKNGVYNKAVILESFNNAVADNLRDEKFDKLKEGNEKVYFQLGDGIGLATGRYDIIVIGRLAYVYLDGKKVMLKDINRVAKRSQCFYDKENSDILSKKYGKETIALTTKLKQKETPDPFLKATLEIEVGN